MGFHWWRVPSEELNAYLIQLQLSCTCFTRSEFRNWLISQLDRCILWWDSANLIRVQLILVPPPRVFRCKDSVTTGRRRTKLVSLVMCLPTGPGELNTWSCVLCSWVHGQGRGRGGNQWHPCLDNHEEPPALTLPLCILSQPVFCCAVWLFSDVNLLCMLLFKDPSIVSHLHLLIMTKIH